MIKTLKIYKDQSIKIKMIAIGKKIDLDGTDCFMIDKFEVRIQDLENKYSKIKLHTFSSWLDASMLFERVLKENLYV